ncbi:hypothetical protein Cni_G07618 [Canna indica]|uniref:Agenet domain-containing protein n=1 Tax=Canna indica TaxID=4628 RepID=A0AAQ3K2F6_9LILI|nr:hypothetical protein Cni_G07618 [Canna indica]
MRKAEGHGGRKRRSIGLRDGGGAFRVGAEVEVRSDEDGFRGAWYEATVVRQFSQRRGFEVVYASIVDDQDPSKPLHEFVKRSNVRPRPPPPQLDPDGGGGAFGLHDLVEAFHNDGWWVGVISAVLHGPATGRYLISFPTSREEEVFEASQIRPQLKWTCGGRWLPVDDQGGDKPMFYVGAHVEVSREREVYGAAWFSASIMKVLSRSIFWVEYENLKAENDSEFLTEIVDVQYIRPYQPNAVTGKDFGVNDEVEMLHHGGWSPGKISKVLDGSQYIVKMVHNEKEMHCGGDELRRRRYWNGEEWVLELQMKNKINGARSASQKRNSQAGELCNLPIPLSSSSDDGEITCESGSIKVGFKHKKTKSHHECSEVFKSKTEVKLLEFEKIPPCKPGTPTADISPSATKPMIENGSSMEQHHSGNLSFVRIGTEPIVGIISPNPLSSELLHALDVSSMNVVTKSTLSDEGPPDIHGEGSYHQSKEDQVSGSPTSPENSEFLPLSEWRYGSGRGSSAKCRKRTTKLVIRTPDRRKKAANDGSSWQVQDDSQIREHSMRCCSGIREPNNSKESAKEIIAISCSRDNDDSSGCLHEDNFGQLCQQNDILMLQGPTSILDIVENSTIKCLVAQSMPDFTSSSFRTPTSGDIFSCPRVYTEHQIVPLEAEENCTERNQNEAPIETHEAPIETLIFEDKGALIDPSSKRSPLKEISLPFPKISSMWESIESMEVFKVMPQQPHFGPLEQYSMEFREGMAIGLMISFANLVSNIQQLHIDDGQATLKERLRALGPLEANGFDVKFLRSRLHELLEIQASRGQCETRKASLEEKILEKKHDNERLDSCITALDKAIMELKQNLSSFYERKDEILVQKSSNDEQISKLQNDMHEADKMYNSTIESFDATLTAPW